ncbi:Disease resistance protein RGA2, partial [Bienertia sinuspersici]
MAELGLAAAQTLFAALQFPELRKVCSIWGYKSQLEDLQNTVSTIKNVLFDAETRELTKEAQGYINELKDAVYDADDLFDEFVTLLKRDDDKNAVIEKLLEYKNEGVCFLSMVGVGGQGKTALAQLVFDDEKVKGEFGDSRPFDASTLETVQKEFQQNIRGKYLLVLDDVWNEDRGKWVELEKFLKIGQEGTRVLVTTRSNMVGTIIGEGQTYELQGLSPEKSWHLFEMAAFNKGHNQQAMINNGMVEIGKKIVAKGDKYPEISSGNTKLRSHISLYTFIDIVGEPAIDRPKKRGLSDFVVGKKSLCGKQCEDELKKLGTLTNLTGRIVIEVGENYRNVEQMKDMSEGYLFTMKCLEEVEIRLAKGCVEHEAMLEKVKPHGNLKGLILKGYNGTTIPRWGRVEDNWAISLLNLVNIKTIDCEELVNLPSFSKLLSLKSLRLEKLCNLEYIEKISSSNNSYAELTFFPSLEHLIIDNLQNLKGWFRGEGLVDVDYKSMRKFQFPCLSTLKIIDCANLTSFPPCSSVEDVVISGVNKATQILVNMMGNEAELQNVVWSCASSIIINCEPINRLPREMEHLTALESLELYGIRQLNFSEDDDEDIMPWKPLHQTLRWLRFWNLDIKNLPKGMQYLTCLQTLYLQECEKLEALPEWISCLSSLQSLYVTCCTSLASLPEGLRNLTSLQCLLIGDCGRMKERCSGPNGEDWPKIRHIPYTHI